MKYQIGDRVIVRDDLEIGFIMYYMENYDESTSPYGWRLNVVEGMCEYFGEEVEIVGIGGEDDVLPGAYIIEHPVYGRDDAHGWTDEMFEGYAEEPVEYAAISLEELL